MALAPVSLDVALPGTETMFAGVLVLMSFARLTLGVYCRSEETAVKRN